jgi:hypothetical protein
MTPSEDCAPRKLAVWPSVTAAGIPLALILIRATPIAPDLAYVLIGIPGMLFLWLVLAVIATSPVLPAMRHKHWPRAASYAVLPLVAGAMLLWTALDLGFIHAMNRAGDMLHLWGVESSYRERVAAMPVVSGERIAVFNWGGMLWASSGAVYDETGEIMLPEKRRSAAWWAQASTTELACSYEAAPAGGHFYLVDFAC